MVYTSLTEAPHNLKEGIDWLMALKGTSGENTLMHMVGTIHHLFSDHSAGNNPLPSLDKIKRISKKFLEKPELRDNMLVKKVLEKFNPVDGTANTGFRRYWHKQFDEYGRVVGVKGAKPEYIEECLSNVMDGFEKLLDDIKNPDQYESAYSAEATWEASCAKNPEDCAVILVGIAPMLYAGLISLWGTSESKTGEFHRFAGSRSFGEVLRALGYVQPQCRADINGSKLFKNFEGLDDDLLHNTYDLAGFDVFYGSKKAAVKSGKLDKDAQDRIDFYVNMKPINPPKKYVLRKQPNTVSAIGSKNFYYPGVPTVANLDAAIPF
ncbi:hypothetical protein BBBOND_0404410 [Babesia bigemina]|uniref:Uncharacterized protein n=1 Tax=Babesia bigemina TaxID=5866 RepID=A0A061DBL9_BABBI|nr:hypothetical protein BBBOND_0404410 [Babesia bigemina]CDR97953.1 hypothetical protein BBBOND_0404410 [Babesia bigemina]|eukprot:XP_012770139.1 hypothetical protein BBBOND_0404410 [Babesia bigemina]